MTICILSNGQRTARKTSVGSSWASNQGLNFVPSLKFELRCFNRPCTDMNPYRDGGKLEGLHYEFWMHSLPTSLRIHQLLQRLNLVTPKQLKVIQIPNSLVIHLQVTVTSKRGGSELPPWAFFKLTCYQHSHKPLDPFFHFAPWYHFIGWNLSDFRTEIMVQSHCRFI